MTGWCFEILQKYSYLLQKDKRYTYYNSLSKVIRVSAEEIIEIQNDNIKRIIKHSYDNVPYYRNLFNRMEIDPSSINSREDLKRVPVLTKSIIRKEFDSLKSTDAYGRNLKLVTSGGSTGNQTIISVSPYYEQMGRASTLRTNALIGWLPSDKSVWIWGAPYENQKLEKSLKAKLGIFINRRKVINAYRYKEEHFDAWIEAINNYRPSVIYGYSSIILQFSKHVLAKQIQLPSVKKVVSTTEKLRERDVIGSAFQCPVYDQYGSREILSIAAELDPVGAPGVMSVFDDTVSLDVGTNNKLIVSALHSYGFPLINYEIGDCGTPVPCKAVNSGAPFSSFSLTIGRDTDNFINHNDELISSSALSTWMSTHRIYIKEQQIVQRGVKDFEISYVADAGFDQGHYEQVIQSCLETYFGDRLTIAFNPCAEIPFEKSGKKLMFKRMFEI